MFMNFLTYVLCIMFRKRAALEELKHENSKNKMDFEDEANEVINNFTADVDRRSGKRIKINNEAEQDTSSDVDVDDPDDPSDEQNQAPVVKITKPKKCTKWSYLKKIPYPLNCDWKDCSYTTYIYKELNEHVGSHIPQLDVQESTDEEDNPIAVYVCLWTDCGAELFTADEAIRHVYFHSLHVKLKSNGARMMADENHPKCLLSDRDRNVIIDLPDPFECRWDSCEIVLQNPQKFYYHVQAHAVSHLAGTRYGNKTLVNCLWRGCRASPRGLQKLALHLFSHTKEKIVACPTCGGTFASNTKFFDHCSRQVPKELNGYQCSHCARSYSTERLLRDHMRNHINSYKCPFCDMTSPTPSSLSLHIRNRHISDKPFKCEYCKYRTQTSHNLGIHMSVHYSTALHKCEYEDCEFSCRTSVTLNKHIRKDHGDGIEYCYCCHLCDVRKAKGAQLSKHLIDKHNFRLPSGHSRFRYKADEDGLYHLETVRYECIVDSQEILDGHLQSQPQQTLVYLNQGSNIPVCTPVFIAYETVDSYGNLVSQLVGGQTLNVPVVQTVTSDPMVQSLPVVVVQEAPTLPTPED